MKTTCRQRGARGFCILLISMELCSTGMPRESNVRRLDQRLAGHGSWLLDTHKLEDSRSNVSELTVLNRLNLLTSVHNDERNIIKRVSSVRCTVLVNSEVSVTVVSCDKNCVALAFSKWVLRMSQILGSSSTTKIFVPTIFTFLPSLENAQVMRKQQFSAHLAYIF